MKKFILSSISALCIVCSVSANDKVVNNVDTVVLKQRIDHLEQRVASLDSQIKVLHTKLTLSQPVNATPKKMVIDRRGSKQVRFE